MGKWIAIIITIIISLFLYVIAHISATSIDDDMQELLDDEQTQIVADMLKEREKKKGKRSARGDNDDGGTK